MVGFYRIADVGLADSKIDEASDNLSEPFLIAGRPVVLGNGSLRMGREEPS